MASNEQLLFANWLRETQRLQVESFDVDPNMLEGPELAEYVTWNITALLAEVGEALTEFPKWKPWVQDRGELTREQRDSFVREWVDVLHFAANVLCAMDCDDTELNELYHRKQQVNRERHADRDYEGRSA